MPAEIQGDCESCGHRWETISLTYRIGPIDYQKDNLTSLWCPQCMLELHCVQSIDRNAWVRWLRSNEEFLTRSHFARYVCETISGIVSNGRLYIPVKVELPEIPCPRCQTLLELEIEGQKTAICPGCNQRSGKLAICAMVSVVYPDGIP